MIRRVVGGDEAAFNHLVSTYWDRVFSHALAYCKSFPQAEEITQDIFLKIWHNRQKLLEVKNFLDYLFILGRNHIISAMRRNVAKTTQIDGSGLIADELEPDRQLEVKQLLDLVLKGMEYLSPQQKAVFQLAKIKGMSYDEVALELQISKRTVRYHLVLALNFLREYLGSEFFIALPMVLYMARTHI